MFCRVLWGVWSCLRRNRAGGVEITSSGFCNSAFICLFFTKNIRLIKQYKIKTKKSWYPTHFNLKKLLVVLAFPIPKREARYHKIQDDMMLEYSNRMYTRIMTIFSFICFYFVYNWFEMSQKGSSVLSSDNIENKYKKALG